MGQVSDMFRSHALDIDTQRPAFEMVPQDRWGPSGSWALSSACSALFGVSPVDVEGGASALEGD